MKLAPTISLLVLALLVGGVGGWLLGGCSAPADVGVHVPNQPNTTHTTQDGNYEFLIPNTWYVEEEPHEPGQFPVVVNLYKSSTQPQFPGNRLESLTLLIFNNPDMKPLTEIDSLQNYYLSEHSGFTNIKVGSRTAVFVPHVPGLILTSAYLLPLNHSVIRIEQTDVNDAEAATVAKLILSTIQSNNHQSTVK